MEQVQVAAGETVAEPRVITDEQIKQYSQMVESWIRNSIVKNWNEADQSKARDEVSLGNSGWTIADMRQYLYTEVFIALRNYKSDQGTKESTFVYGHLSNRVGSLMKKLTKKSKGYGIWSSNIEEVLGEVDSDD
jgi:hypothetical protein